MNAAAVRLRGRHPLSADEPDEKDEERDKDISKVMANSRVDGAFSLAFREQVGQAHQVEICDVLDIDITNLWLSVCLVLVNDAGHLPSRHFPHNTNDAAGSVLKKS